MLQPVLKATRYHLFSWMGLACALWGHGRGAGYAADSTILWTTNHYYVTGTTLSGIRQSMNHARPGGKSSKTDGLTVWKVSWDYQLDGSGAGCRMASFSTKTTISITMPTWVSSAQADAELKKAWARYYAALLRHEMGHAQIAQMAATEIRHQVGTLGSSADCSSLRNEMRKISQKVIADFRQRDVDYDRRTRHGINDGAHFP